MLIVNRINIDTQLKKIEELYSDSLANSHDLLLPKLYAKLYIIETCGWIEETTDSILSKSYLDRYNINNPNSQSLIKKNYSFDYDSLKKMNMNILGIKNFSIIDMKMKKKLDNAKTYPNFSDFKGSLTFLKKERDRIAHTQTTGHTQNITAPSLIIPHFNKIVIALKIFENEVDRLR